MKILLTGGHLGPALAILDEIGQKDTVVFVGRKFINDREKNHSLEYKEIAKRHIHFHHLAAGRFTRMLSLKSFINLLKIPVGFLQALHILRQEKPDVIMSFGGYIGLTVAATAFLLRIPVYTHEQTMRPGLANKAIGFFAKNIFVSFPETTQYFPKAKVIMTGNPIRKSVLKVLKKPFMPPEKQPVLLVMGGSVGAHSINVLIEQIAEKLLERYTILHQTGNVKEYSDFERLSKLRETLSPDIKNRYILREHFLEDEMGYVYSVSDLAISRAGANSFSELLSWRKPTLFIPLPWSAAQEQRSHAQFFRENGIGEVLEQGEGATALYDRIEDMIKNLEKYRKNFTNLKDLPNQNAATLITSVISKNRFKT